MSYLITDSNIRNVRSQINKKKSFKPYIATIDQVSQVVTDYDNFPYNRWYRGIPSSHQPIVAEREAGWRNRQDNCYKVNQPSIDDNKNSYPNHCFESPCSTVFPCYPEYLTKHADREALNVMLNKACVVQYR